MEGKNTFMSGLYVVTDWFVNLAFLNVLFLILNIPFWLELLNLVSSGSGSLWSVGTLVILSVFLFFPTLEALFRVGNQLITTRESIKILKTYVLQFKKYYRSSLKASSLLSLIWFLLILDYYVLNNISHILGWLVLFIGIVFFVVTLNFYAQSVNSDETLKVQWMSSLKNTIRRPKIMLLFLMVNMLMIILIILSAWFLIPFFVVSANVILALKIQQLTTLLSN